MPRPFARLTRRPEPRARITLPDRYGGGSFVMTTAGGTDQIAVAHERHGWGAFEAPFPDVFASLCRALGGRVLDIGANTGFYSLIATAAHPTISVIAFEPLAAVHSILERNVERNEQRARIEVDARAVGATVGEATLYIPDAGQGLVETSASLSVTFKEHDSTVTVSVTTLDASIDRWRDTTIVKIDVEGFEHGVIQGGLSFLARYRPLVFLEILPGTEFEILSAAKQSLSYTDVRLRPGGIVVGEPLQFDPDGWNHLWIPTERVEEIVALIDQ